MPATSWTRTITRAHRALPAARSRVAARYKALSDTFKLWPLPFNGRALALGEYGGLGLVLQGHEWSPETSWAYGVSDSAEQLGQRLQALAQRATELFCQDLVSAVVYTQWNDVEEEINGLVSYDRHQKLPKELLRHVNEQLQEARARKIACEKMR